MIRPLAVPFALLLLVASSLAAGAASPVTVTDPWARPSSGSVQVYATVVNAGDDADRLIGATSPSATGAELHDASKSAPVAAIAIPAHGSVTLASSGAFVTFTGLKADIGPTDLFFARLHFERAGWIVAVVHIRPV